ncbi:MAG: hypothetical protein IJR68_09380 [Fretibacterium sp.]|nr:hypothetical protein [Fretibacterium sp.]
MKTLKELKEKEESTGTAYDDAFRTLLVKRPHLVIPLINEAFGEDYPMNAGIELSQNEHFLTVRDGSVAKRITDSSLKMWKNVRDLGRKYILEAQSVEDGRVLIRIAEYVLSEALENSGVENDTLRITVAHAAVLYLRSGIRTPDAMTIEIVTSGGEVSFSVPIVKMAGYTLNQIFEKKLFFLLPFYIFTREKELAVCNEDRDKLAGLEAEFAGIMTRLNSAVEARDIDVYDLRVIVDMMEHVLKKIAEKYSNVREGVGAVMGGRVLRVQGEEFYNAGVERGLEQGLERGLEQGLERGLEQGLERGLEQGRREERQSIMARLIAGGISTQEAARYVGLTV